MRLIRFALILLLAGLSPPIRPAAAQAAPVPGPCQGTPLRRRVVRIAVAETSRPSLRSSPRTRW
jgi:hypothetical protein